MGGSWAIWFGHERRAWDRQAEVPVVTHWCWPGAQSRDTALPAPCGECVCSLCCVTSVPTEGAPTEGNTGERGKV